MLKPGDVAPDFRLPGDDGKIYSLKDFAKQKLILYFYPRDNTPGCAIEACELRDHRVRLDKHDARILGVSPDTVASHQKWQAKERFGFPLLSDPDHAAATAYGAWGEKTLYGRKFMGIIRSTFVIVNGRIERAMYKVSPRGHAADLLAGISGKAAPAKPSAPAKKPAAKKPAAKSKRSENAREKRAVGGGSGGLRPTEGGRERPPSNRSRA
jgi:thioredoxin-dependent peroxiredoxin